MNSNHTTIQINDNFVGVLVNGQRAGFVNRNPGDTDWNAQTMTSTGVGVVATRVANVDEGARWIADHTA